MSVQVPSQKVFLPDAWLVRALNEGGLCIDYGACVARVRSDVSAFSQGFFQLYRHFSLRADAPFADFHIEVSRGKGFRRWVRPQSRFLIDRVQPFDPFAASHALPHY